MNTNLSNQIVNELIIIAGIMAPLLTALKALWKSKLKELAETKISCIKNEDLRKAAQEAYDIVKDLIPQEITNAEVKLKPAILQTIADGKVTKDELCKLNGIVRDKVLSQLTDDAKKALESKIPNVNSYLESNIETVLSKLKLDPTSVVSKTVIPEASTVSSEIQTVSLEDYQKVLDEKSQLKSQLDSVKSLLNKSDSPNSNTETDNNSSEETNTASDTSKVLLQA